MKNIKYKLIAIFLTFGSLLVAEDKNETINALGTLVKMEGVAHPYRVKSPTTNYILVLEDVNLDSFVGKLVELDGFGRMENYFFIFRVDQLRLDDGSEIFFTGGLRDINGEYGVYNNIEKEFYKLPIDYAIDMSLLDKRVHLLAKLDGGKKERLIDEVVSMQVSE